MDNTNNKKTIRFLYDSVFNTKQFDKLSSVVSEDYSNPQGGKGLDGFQKPILDLQKAFPDAQWKAEEIIGEENKVVVRQKFSGKQTSQFGNIPSTGKSVSVDGIATYEFRSGKIIHSQVQTDRLGFLQQLGVVPVDLSPKNKNESMAVYLIDRILVPKKSIGELKVQMQKINAYISNLSGFIKREGFEQFDNEGNLTLITIAVWEDPTKLNEAIQAIQLEFKRMEFNPADFFQRLNVKMERGQYTYLKE